MTKVLIADDSPTARALLETIVGSDPDLEVIGVVVDGQQAVEFIRTQRPDVITMDIDMPQMDGFEATRRIMETTPVPVVIVSGLSLSEQRASFHAFEAGALAVVPRPPGPADAGHAEAVRQLLETVKAMAGVRLVRRWPKRAIEQTVEGERPQRDRRRLRIVGMGASTGGPAVFKTILDHLPDDFPFPILLVQHMSRGFLQGFVDWLQTSTGKPVQLAREGAAALPGHVYVAPEDRHLGLSERGKILLSSEDDGTNLRPSVSWLFHSLAESYGRGAVGVLLTGMGRDGAESLKRIQERGGVTIVQEASTCVVHGMPNEALKLGAAEYELSPERISAILVDLAEH